MYILIVYMYVYYMYVLQIDIYARAHTCTHTYKRRCSLGVCCAQNVIIVHDVFNSFLSDSCICMEVHHKSAYEYECMYVYVLSILLKYICIRIHVCICIYIHMNYTRIHTYTNNRRSGLDVCGAQNGRATFHSFLFDIYMYMYTHICI